MTTRRPHERESFADVVVELRRRRPPQRLGGTVEVPTRQRMHAPDGTTFTTVVRELRASQALTLLVEGAHVAWDVCGCGAAGCHVWLDATGRAALVAAGPPDVTDGGVWLWSDGGDRAALVCEAGVVWGDLMA